MTRSGPVSRAPQQRAAFKGVVLILMAAFCFSLMPVFTRAIVDYPSTAIVFYRALFGVVTLATLTALPAGRQSPTGRSGRALVLPVLALGVSMCLSSVLYLYAVQHTTVAKAVLLNYTGPIYVAIVGPALLHEARPRLGRIAVPLGITGMVLVIDPLKLGGFAPGEVMGIVAGALSGFSFAAIFILGRYLAGKIEPIRRALLGGAIVVLLTLPWGVSVSMGPFWHNLPFLVGLGTLCMALPFVLMFRGQAHVSAQVGSMVALFEPVCVAIIGYVLYGEQLSVLGIVGGAAVLASIYLSSQ